MARPLVANNDLVHQFAAGRDRAEQPCTYCNKCLVHVVEHPIGCYEEKRFPRPRRDAAGGDVGLSAAGVFVISRARVRTLVRRLVVAAVVMAAIVVVWVDRVDLRAIGPRTYDAIEEHFKYGSIGSEPGGSLLAPVGGVLPPYWVFTALPSICSDKLPRGYATFGFIVEPGHDLPIGVARRRRLGIDQVGLNCAACHTGTVRDAPGAQPQIVLGMPAQQLDLEAFVQFVLDCTLDNRLTADAVRGRLPRQGGPSLFERSLLRVGLVDRLKLQTLSLRNRIAPVLAPSLPALGPGPCRHVQSLQGHPVQLGSRQAAAFGADVRVGFPVAVEPEAARGTAAALGRQQRLG